MNILVVDDDPVLASSICKSLKKDARIRLLNQAHTYSDAMQAFNKHHYNIIILDIELCSEENGLTLCQYFRKQNPKSIIVMITGYDSIEYVKTSFRHGANDYIRKVNLRNELLIRINNWWAYVSSGNQSISSLEYKGLIYCFSNNEFSYLQDKLALSKGLKRLLLLFIKSPAKVISHQQIQRELWGDHECSIRPRNIHERVRVLNNHLPERYPARITNVFGEGYKLDSKRQCSQNSRLRSYSK